MSLTSELDNPDSLVRKFIEERFPHTRTVTRDANTRLRRVETIRPNGPVPWTTLGTAFDYRARYYFQVSSSRELVAWNGALAISGADSGWEDTDEYDWNEPEPGLFSAGSSGEVVALRKRGSKTQIYTGHPLVRGLDPSRGDGPISSELVMGFFSSLEETLEQMDPAGRLLEWHAEELLARYCIVLALFEEFARPGAAHAQTSSPLLRCGADSTVEDLLKIAEDHWVDDLCSLSQLFFQVFQDRFSHHAILNPTFQGSDDVDGADADIIVNNCLMEFKTTVKASVEKVPGLYQLIGYALLDYDDKFGIEELGFYMARQGQIIEWPIVNLFERLMGQKPPSLQDIRREFRDALTKKDCRVK